MKPHSIYPACEPNQRIDLPVVIIAGILLFIYFVLLAFKKDKSL